LVDHLLVAKKHLIDNELNSAAIELKNAIKETPDLAEAHFLLGKLYFDTIQFEGAVQQFERAIQYKHPKKEVLLLLAQSYKATESDHALIDLRIDNVGLSPEQTAEIKLYQLQAYLRLDKQHEGKLLIDEIRKMPVTSSFIDLAEVYETLLADNDYSAKYQLASILRKDKTQPDALKLQAIIQLQVNDTEGALSTYRTYTNAYPNDLVTSFIFARLLALSNQTEEAEPIVDKLLTINADNPLLNQIKGLARFNEGDNENALLYLEKSLLNGIAEVGTRLAAGISAYKLKDYQKSHLHLSSIATDLPSSHPALRILASSQLALGLSLEASDTISSFDQLNVEDGALLSSLGLSLSLKGEKVKAKNVLTQFNQISNSNTIHLPQLGLLKLSLEDVEGAADLEKLLGSLNENSAKSNGIQKNIENILARTYVASKQFDKALELAKNLKANEKNAIQGYMLAGFTYNKQNKKVLAKAEFEKALAIEPNNTTVKLSLIDLMPSDSLDDKQKIVSKLDDLLEQEPEFIPLLSRYYIYNKQLGNAKQAVEFTQNSFNNSPKKMSLALTLGNMYFKEGQYQKTISTLSSVDKNTIKPSIYWQLLAHSYVKERLFTQATSTYDLWLEKYPSNKEAILGNILALQAQNKVDEALQLSDFYMSKRGSDTAVSVLRLGLFIKKGKFKIAQQAYYKLPAEAYNLPIVMGYLGEILLNESKFKQALPRLELAYNNKPTPENTYLVYQCLVGLDKHENAYDFLLKHSTSHPNDILMLMKLSALQVTIDSKQAEMNYVKILKLDSNNALANNNLAYLLSEKGQNQKALKYAKDAVRLKPENSNYLDTLGRILLDLNKDKDALKHLSKAVINSANNINQGIYLNYIEALIVNKKTVLAKRKLNDIKFTGTYLDKKQKLSQLLLK